MRKAVVLVFSLLILVLDQWTKALAARELRLNQPVEIIPKCFNLTLVHNPGAAFGIFANLPDGQRRTALGLVSIVAVIALIWFIVREGREDRLSLYALASILSGAIGNIIDRLRFDSVIDFADFYIGKYHWPAFNVADSAISLGVCLIAYRILFVKKSSSRSIPLDDKIKF